VGRQLNNLKKHRGRSFTEGLHDDAVNLISQRSSQSATLPDVYEKVFSRTNRHYGDIGGSNHQYATEQLEGGCLSGAVRFVSNRRPKASIGVIARSCRRHTGAPVAVFAVFDCEAYKGYQGAKLPSSIRHPGAENPTRILRAMRVNFHLRDK